MNREANTVTEETRPAHSPIVSFDLTLRALIVDVMRRRADPMLVVHTIRVMGVG